MEPYSVSKMMRYLFHSGANNELAFKKLTVRLVDTLRQRVVTLEQSELKDPLVDIEMNDVVDMVRVLATLSYAPADSSFTPKLFLRDSSQIGDTGLQINPTSKSSTNDLANYALK